MDEKFNQLVKELESKIQNNHDCNSPQVKALLAEHYEKYDDMTNQYLKVLFCKVPLYKLLQLYLSDDELDLTLFVDEIAQDDGFMYPTCKLENVLHVLLLICRTKVFDVIDELYPSIECKVIADCNCESCKMVSFCKKAFTSNSKDCEVYYEL